MFRSLLKMLVPCTVILVASGSSFAQIRLPHAISDHAVLQRNRPIHIWGWATPGAHLAAHLNKQSVPATADDLGKWSLWFAPEAAGGPFTLTLSGDGPETTVSDLLLGDVWFASGQSNMEMPLAGFPNSAVVKDSAKEIATAGNPRLRLLLVDRRTADFPLDDTPATWTTCTPETAAKFSAVAYFFGREIAQKEDVPVGLIDSTWGGTPADSWISMNTLGTNPQLLPAFAARATFAEHLADNQAMISAEQREDAAAKAAGKPAPSHQWHPAPASWSPATLYNGMIAPFAPYSITGLLWYQGETNSGPGRAPFYSTLFPALISDWRERFGQGTLPFLFVQISSYNSPGESWGTVRDAQRRTLSLAQTAMAVTLDVGAATNVHPPDKQTVGARLALAARAMVYGERVPYVSPLYRETIQQQQLDGTVALQVFFDNAERLTAHGQPLDAFEIAGEDHHFVRADARLDGETVVVRSGAVTHPVYVRYAWAGVVDHNLFNAAGLPASTFTSEPDPVR